MKAYEIFYYQYLTQRLRSRQALLLSAVLLLLAVGWGAAIWRGQQVDAEIRQQLLAQAKAVARTINPQRIKALSFTAADIDRPAFQRLRGQMRNYAQATGQRGIYSIALRDGAMIFGPESFAADDPLASPPGTVYQRPPAELNEIFQDGQPRAIGSYTDEYGVFISAYAPVADSRTGQPLLIIAIDIEASQWRAQVWRARAGPLLFILGLIALLLAGAVLFKRRDRWPAPRQMRWHHLETHLATVVGLLLTGGAVWLVHNGETHSRQAIFSQIAEARADSLVRKFLNFRDHQLAGLAQFFKNSELVTRVEFQRYAELFVETTVQAYEWIPQVPATAKLALETEMRREGFKAFTIFEKDARGASLPAKTRDVYYPVIYIEPLAGNETALGYDLGSEPTRRAALEETLQTGLPTATDPIRLVQATSAEQLGVLAYYPVFTDLKPTGETVRNASSVSSHGFVLAVLRLTSALVESLAQSGYQDAFVYVDMLQLSAEKKPVWLAFSSEEHARHHPSIDKLIRWNDNGLASMVYPLFVFGKTYTLVTHPGPAFLAAYPQRAGVVAGGVGLLLTGVLTAFVGFLNQRRVSLENLVQARTTALQENQERYRVLFESLRDAVFVADATTGFILRVNQAAEKLLNRPRSEIIGLHQTAIHPPSEMERYVDQFQRYVTGETGHVDAEVYTCDGRRVPVEITSSLIRMPDGTLTIQGIFRDATERQRALEEREAAEAALHRLAHYDSLTHLPNRRLFLDHLANAQAIARRSGHYGAILLVDLDDFKQVNDARGHAVGDQILCEVAARLTGALREEDLVAHFGSDEFVVLLANLANVQQVAARLARNVANKIHAAILTPFPMPNSDCALGASIGVTLFPKDLERDDDLLKEADTAMHRAKAAGRNNVYFFEAAMQAEVENRFALESELRRAMGRDELRLYFQPQVDRNGRIVAAEALLRWQHPERGLIPPLHFIPLAEETGLIVPMGEWVLEKTCHCLARIAVAGQTLRLAVNVSPRQLRQPNFAKRIKALLTATGADPDRLTLEMTEGLAIENIDSAIITLSELKTLGIHLSIDDFGTGYSSLAYLKRLPMDELKIDRSFIRDIPGDPNDVALVEAILAVARHLSLAVVAEGVETEEQVAFLRARDCNLYQGYLFGRPEPAETFLQSL